MAQFSDAHSGSGDEYGQYEESIVHHWKSAVLTTRRRQIRWLKQPYLVRFPTTHIILLQRYFRMTIASHSPFNTYVAAQFADSMSSLGGSDPLTSDTKTVVLSLPFLVLEELILSLQYTEREVQYDHADEFVSRDGRDVVSLADLQGLELNLVEQIEERNRSQPPEPLDADLMRMVEDVMSAQTAMQVDWLYALADLMQSATTSDCRRQAWDEIRRGAE